MRMLIPLLVACVCGCNSPEAPSELSDLLRFFFSEYDDEDPRVLEAAATNMAEYLDGVDYTGDSQSRSTIPDPLQEGDMGVMTRADDTVLEDTINLSLAYASSRPILDHARLQAEEDHTLAEPTAESYARTWDDELDPNCFADRTCDLMRTTNQIARSNALFAVEFELFKHFRWTETEDGRSMIVARSWFDGVYPSSRGTATLYQSYTLDVWLEEGDATRRVQVLYSESRFDPPIEEHIKRNTTRVSIDDAMEATDEALATMFD